MRLRDATASDAAAMAELARTAGVVGWSGSALLATVQGPMGRAWVAEREGRVLGFALARLVADEAELLLIAVQAGLRRQGLGRALYAHLEVYCRQADVHWVHLEVAEDNTAARALYRGLGFEPVGRRAGYYGQGRAAILMRKGLRPKSVVQSPLDT